MAGGAVTLDFTNYKEQVSDYIPEGEYDLLVDSVDHDKTGPNSKNPGTLMVVVTFQVIGGQFEGATIIERFTITEKALFRIAGFMKAIGLKVQKGKKVKLDTNKFVGKRVHAVIKDDTFRDEKRSTVASYSPYGKETAEDTGADIEDVAADEADVVSSDSEPDEKKVDTSKSPWNDESSDAEEIDLDEL